LACAWPALEVGAGLMAVLSAVQWIAPLAVIAWPQSGCWPISQRAQRSTPSPTNAW
jgi:hypothetical protein